ncbi:MULTISPECIES: Imm8 family immunity protein [unclassified Leptospira]|uniref:Imm8 family immunity protein n=1 Tax=unclassified Leptospira TaxID=2633828 RepID=UPI00056B445C|nr:MULTISPECIES: Imm8 family immunity protein [unclassified Leptospira]MCR1795728.1 immunity 8 family protein [Leptospira sp. id769339]
MKKPVIRAFDFDANDHDPIEDWVPEDPYDIDIWITFSIGPSDEIGSDYFDGHFITKNYEEKYALVSKSPYFLIERYSLSAILEMVTVFIESCSRADWEQTAKEICKKLDWEFEGYHPASYPTKTESLFARAFHKVLCKLYCK